MTQFLWTERITTDVFALVFQALGLLYVTWEGYRHLKRARLYSEVLVEAFATLDVMRHHGFSHELTREMCDKIEKALKHKFAPHAEVCGIHQKTKAVN